MSGQSTVVFTCVRPLVHALSTVRRVVPIDASNNMHSWQEFVCVDLVSVFAGPGGSKQTNERTSALRCLKAPNQWSAYAFCYCAAGWDNPVGRSVCIIWVPVTWDCLYNVNQLFHDGFHIYTTQIPLSLARRRILSTSAHALRLLARYGRESVAVSIGCWLRVAGWWLADWLMGGLTGFRVMYNVMAGSVWV